MIKLSNLVLVIKHEDMALYELTLVCKYVQENTYWL